MFCSFMHKIVRQGFKCIIYYTSKIYGILTMMHKINPVSDEMFPTKRIDNKYLRIKLLIINNFFICPKYYGKNIYSSDKQILISFVSEGLQITELCITSKNNTLITLKCIDTIKYFYGINQEHKIRIEIQIKFKELWIVKHIKY